jgi:hypothetical protein
MDFLMKADACKKLFSEVKSAAELRHHTYNAAKAKEAEKAALVEASNAANPENEGKRH